MADEIGCTGELLAPQELLPEPESAQVHALLGTWEGLLEFD